MIATGSGSFEFSNIINEPLTGNKYVFTLMTVLIKELIDTFGWIETNSLLDERIIYGIYPEIISKPD